MTQIVQITSYKKKAQCVQLTPLHIVGSIFKFSASQGFGSGAGGSSDGLRTIRLRFVAHRAFARDRINAKRGLG